MDQLKKWRRKHKTTVVAVCLDLETAGFDYRKWGEIQRCKPGDWVLCNAGDTYTVDAATFLQTYREVSPGIYEKVAPVWAEHAHAAGTIRTKEGATRYQAGDVLVYNDSNRKDGYAMSADRFESLYEPDES